MINNFNHHLFRFNEITRCSPVAIRLELEGDRFHGGFKILKGALRLNNAKGSFDCLLSVRDILLNYF